MASNSRVSTLYPLNLGVVLRKESENTQKTTTTEENENSWR